MVGREGFMVLRCLERGEKFIPLACMDYGRCVVLKTEDFDDNVLVRILENKKEVFMNGGEGVTLIN